jgi:hypothetical protein
MQNGLGMNTTIESLELYHFPNYDDNSDLWCRSLSFLRTNKALKSLMINLEGNVTESRATACRTTIALMLQENASLESLSIQGWSNEIQAEEYVKLIIALLHNTTLKSIIFQREGSICFTDDEDKQVAVLLKKNYELESLPDVKQGGDVGAILQLNKAGRRYLVQDGSSISKGVKVLSAVSNEIDCVFLHLLENPRLCDRSALEETANASTDGIRGSTISPANHNGKREQDQDQAFEEGKESRRRLT